MFPSTQVVMASAKGSDHNPLILNLEATSAQSNIKQRRIFRFEAMWTRSAECAAVIRDLWGCDVSGAKGSRLLQRLCTVREGLIGWDKSSFGHVRTRVKELEKQLEVPAKDPVSSGVCRAEKASWGA
ncbi:UNVERIFIED_CONTAM: hypothetical protein Slati_4232500 [Sesamum latifolium]|uniref:Endonuclease/exonuclease/phosphatase n=1 Tax=Sesamum latifolium TaxID=2727402 RepID=A0AAW2TE75_9LAMI